LTTLAQTWSVFSFSNLAPTSHTFDINLDRAKLVYALIHKMDMNLGSFISSQITLMAQHNSLRLDFLALITALCKTQGVHSISLTHERLSPAINLAYIKKNYWNLDDLSVTFRGPHKAKGKRSEAPSSFEAPSTLAPKTPTPSSSITPLPLTHIPVIPPAPTQIPLLAPLSIGPLDFIFTPMMLHSMLQSIHRGQSIIMQSLQSLGLSSIMSMEEFDARVAWPGDQPSSSGGGGASAALEPMIEEPLIPVAAAAAKEETTPEETQPSTPVTEPEQPILDSSVALALDLNEDQPQEEQDV